MSALVAEIPGTSHRVLSARLQHVGRINRRAILGYLIFELVMVFVVPISSVLAPYDLFPAVTFFGVVAALVGLVSAVLLAIIWAVNGFVSEDLLTRRYVTATQGRVLSGLWCVQLGLCVTTVALIGFPFVTATMFILYGSTS